MSQGLSSSSLIQLGLTPMQLMEAQPISVGTDPNGSVPDAGSTWNLEGLDSPSQQPSLRLTPGESSELLVQIKNISRSPLAVGVTVVGDFPQDWCQLHTEGREIPADRSMDAVLRFAVDANFFEARQGLGPEDRLTLSHRCQVHIHRLGDQNQRQSLIGQADFLLYLRPYSLYPRFLPAIYREVDFIGRFLKIFEQSFEPTVDAFQSLWAYLDPLTAPEALLPFLAHWVGWPGQVPWSAAQQRRLIQRALELYRWRGTRRGLRLYLHLYTGLPADDRHIQITESFTRGFELGSGNLGETTIVGGGRPFHFSVRLQSPDPEALDEPLVRRIIDQEKPAFCTYDLQISRSPNLPPPP